MLLIGEGNILPSNFFLLFQYDMKNYLGAIVSICVIFYKIVGSCCEEFYAYNSSTIILEECDDDPNKYKCFDNTCIDKSKYCNGIIDCRSTAEDERDCNRCPAGLCQLINGLCFNRSLESSWWLSKSNVFIDLRCKTIRSQQIVHSVDCTGVGLTYLPCLFPPPDTLILNENYLGAFNSLSDSTFLGNDQLAILELASNDLTYLPPNIFQNLRNLTRLSLLYNKIRQLDEDIFKNLHNLQYLNLGHNKLTQLPENILSNLRNLVELLLSYNKIDHLDENILQNQSRLQRFYLQDSDITELPPKMFHNSRELIGLYLDGNRIRYLDNYMIFQNLSNLEYLSLANNDIEYLNGNIFQDLHKLEYLYLNNNNIANLSPNIFRNLQNLAILSMDSNRIRYLDGKIFQNLSSLWILNLKNNKLFDLPSNIFDSLKNLGELTLTNNRIQHLDEAVFQNLCSLEFLRLGKNRLSNLPANVFKNMKNLLMLWVPDNKIQYLNVDVFQNLRNLNSLNLNRNNILDLPSNVFQNLENLSYLWLEANPIQRLYVPVFENLHSLQRLYLRKNNIVYLESYLFQNLKNLTELWLAENQIQHLDGLPFENLHKLESLYLNGNYIEYLPPNVFRNLKNLKTLHLEGNRIKNLNEQVFENQFLMQMLNLSNNQLTELPARMLKKARLLETLYLENNKIKIIDEYSFSKLSRLLELNIKTNQIGDVNANIFKDLKKLRSLITDEFRFCCLKKNIKHCKAPNNEFSSCDDLLKNVLLRIFIWISGTTAIVANTFVLYVRVKYQNAKTNKVNSFLIMNLAVSDLIMGVYLLMIAITDARYRGEYYLHDLPWRQSYWCDMAGVLSTLSSELTVFILTVISIDRLIAVTFPFRTMRRGLNRTRILMTVVWVLAAAISLVPHQFFGIPYFKNFYGRSGVCLALHITDETPGGWEYSVFVFIILNAISFVVIAISYLLMYYQASKRKRGIITSSNQHSDTVMALRMTLLVLADAACWIPIIVLGIRSLIGYSFPPDVYPWIAVFVLPLNAAINPILYTISSIPLVIGAEFEKHPVNGQPSIRIYWRGLLLKATRR